jgi:hypothetical protein
MLHARHKGGPAEPHTTAAGTEFLHLAPADFTPVQGGHPAEGIGAGFGRGLGFGPWLTAAAAVLFRVPAAVALAAGITVELLLADDNVNPFSGQIVTFGVTIGPLIPDVSTLDDQAETNPLQGAVEATGTVTMPDPSGRAAILSIAVPVEDMAGVKPGMWALLRLRRMAQPAADTHGGRVVVLGVDLRDT